MKKAQLFVMFLMAWLTAYANKIDVFVEGFLTRFPSMRAALAGEKGMVGKVVSVILLIVVLGAIVPALWPVMQDTDTDIQALNATGSTSTAFLQTVWPIVLLVIGIGVAAGLIFYALRRFGVLGGR